MQLSIVASLYMSAPYIEEFCTRSEQAARQLAGEDFEIVLVNDGSPDNSLDVARKLIDTHPQLKIVDLSRNFGHHKAMLTGLAYARGERVFLLDVDLEEEPEWLLSFDAQMRREGCDVVYGVQRQRKGGWFERWTGEAYYRLFNFLADMRHPRNITTARLMTKKYVEALLQYKECEAIFSCLCALAGFYQHEHVVTKHSTSPTTYSTRKKVKMLFDSIVSFSAFPLELIFYCGVFISVLALCSAGYLAFMKIFFAHVMDGWTSIMVSIWLLGGMIISFVGVIGMYISKIFTETKQRPRTIVRNIYANKYDI